MPTTVTLTTAPTAPTEPDGGPVPYEYIETIAEDYSEAYADALARVPDGRRAIAVRADRI